ncbi:secondary thiamine-phosphate synthase enzyme YjbQ [candidate division KSB1 bacterium]
MIINDTITLTTQGNADIIDITQNVWDIITRNDVKDGLVTLFVPGSTGALTSIEYEPGAVSDLRAFLDEIIPPDKNYRHNLAWGDGNGHSHLRAALLGPSLSIPVVDTAMTLGTWQQIIFIDCDNRPRSRTIIVQIYTD